jgi:hypothetical protein
MMLLPALVKVQVQAQAEEERKGERIRGRSRFCIHLDKGEQK